MYNPYLAQEAIIKKSKIESKASKVTTLQISLIDKELQSNLEFEAGQFFMIGVPSIGESAISISSSPHIKDYFELTLREVGKVTKALGEMKAGQKVTIRGPFGRGWPKINVDDEIILIAGGIGLPAVKPILDDYCHGYLHAKKVSLFYGTTNFEKLVCLRYYALWEKEADLFLNLNNQDKRWKYHVGRLTEMLREANLSKNSKVFLIGPPLMYKSILEELSKKGIPDRQIFISLERRMHCGVGVCQHCSCGHLYACKHGPVFRYDKVKDIPDII
jgi:NAD(P)H-flavin reductase